MSRDLQDAQFQKQRMEEEIKRSQGKLLDADKLEKDRAALQSGLKLQVGKFEKLQIENERLKNEIKLQGAEMD